MNVIIVSITFIPSIILCGHSQLLNLEKLGKVNYKFVIAHFITNKDIEWADIVIFVRSDSEIEAYAAKKAKEAGKHLVYVLDDDILNVPSYLSCAPNYLLPSTQKSIRTIMSCCNTFLTTSPVLLEKYGKDFEYAGLISEPSLNRINKKPTNDKIKIGFAGSIDRVQDLNEILEETIGKLVDKYGDSISIEFMGAKPNFLEKYNLQFLPYQESYDAYTAFMSKCNWDIGLAPMPDSEFHRCKYFNKFIEYASFGIVGVYSNLEPYVYGIKNGVNGLLVNNTTNEWFKAICKLIDNEKLRKKMSAECLKQANEKYTLEICADDYFKKITKNYSPVEEQVKIFSFDIAKFIFTIKRGFRKIKEEGTNFPNWLSKKIDKKIDYHKERIEHAKNLEILEQQLESRNTISIVTTMDPISEEYNERVQLIDDNLRCYRMYVHGEDRTREFIHVNFLHDNHVEIVFNSFDASQMEKALELIRKTNKCVINRIDDFTREKLAPDMFKIFEFDDFTVAWDTHGQIPEEYHELGNYHIEEITNDIEKIFFENADVIICENNDVIKHFKKKYKNNKKEYILFNIDTKINSLNKIIV